MVGGLRNWKTVSIAAQPLGKSCIDSLEQISTEVASQQTEPLGTETRPMEERCVFHHHGHTWWIDFIPFSLCHDFYLCEMNRGFFFAFKFLDTFYRMRDYYLICCMVKIGYGEKLKGAKIYTFRSNLYEQYIFVSIEYFNQEPRRSNWKSKFDERSLRNSVQIKV